MRKINWEDLPSRATPINAENLNAMQDNIEDEINLTKDEINLTKAVELYYDSTAALTSAALNDHITNYDIIVIIGQSSDGYQCSTTIYKPYSGAKITLMAPQITNNSAIYNKQAVFEFTSTLVLQSVQNHELQGNTTVSTGSYIKLKAVLGYKL